MKPFSVGIIGLGDISGVYIDNLKQYNSIITILGCASRGLEKAQRASQKYGIPRAYASGSELIADPDIDIVLNLTVPAVHGEYNLAALRAGKHVYSEKPLAADLKTAREIIELAKQKNLYAGCAPDTFMGSRLQTCRKLLDEGTIGRVIGAGAYCLHHGVESFHPNPFFFYQDGAGPLLDIGPYYITALLSLLGPVARCSAMASRGFDERTALVGPSKGKAIPVSVDTHIIGQLEFTNGALAAVITSFDVWDSEMPRLEIYGTEGTLCMNDPDPLDGPNLFGGQLLLRTKDNSRWLELPRTNTAAEWTVVPQTHRFNSTVHTRNSRGIGLVDMAYAIRQNRPCRASGEMACHSLEVMMLMLRSAHEHRFFEPESSFTRPEIMPEDFPDSEQR